MKMPVAEVIKRFSKEELVQWMGYEKTCSPLDSSRVEELMLAILQQQYRANWMQAEKMYVHEEDGKKYLNPLGEDELRSTMGVPDIPRPHDDWTDARPFWLQAIYTKKDGDE